jgi:DNA repair protein RecO (recombination protein O)
MGLQGNSLDEKIIRSFEIKLLSELGYGLFPRTEEAQLTAWQQNEFYRFHSTTGWVKCESNEVYQRFSYSGETILAIAKEEWHNETILLQAKHLLRQVLTELMNNKPIYSRQMFIKVMEIME